MVLRRSVKKKQVVIARRGSQQFAGVLKLTNEYSNPDFAYWLPPVYADHTCTEVLQKEELIISERIDDVLDENALAIMIDDYESPERKGCDGFTGQYYQYIYPGDEVYVMNSHGSTIEAIK